MSVIYGVDTEKPVTALMVRDAIVECFATAHCQDTALDSDGANLEASKKYCIEIVRKAFEESQLQFDAPTKEGLMIVIERLAQFSSSFRNPDIINSHKQEIQSLISLIQEQSSHS